MSKSYTGQQRFLLQAAERYTNLGYQIGFAKGKEFLGVYQPAVVTSAGWWGMPIKTEVDAPDDFNAISLIPNGVVCVDIDEPDFGLVWEPLPPTWKERTPRGWHLFYYLDPEDRDKCNPKINWRPHVDLLTVRGVPSAANEEQRVVYGRKPSSKTTTASPIWGGHVLISRSDGYTLVYPDQVPPLAQLTPAPDWLVYQLSKP